MDRFWLESHPWERDLRWRHGCAAIGGPEKNSDEAVMLFVVRKDPSLTKEALTAYCHHLLTGTSGPSPSNSREAAQHQRRQDPAAVAEG